MSSKKILLVENETAFRERFCDRLKKEGYKVDLVCTIEEANELLRYKRFCLYIIGVDFPDNSGFELCKRIRKISKNPMMCLTGRDDETIIIRCLRMGADACVVKPFAMKIMIERVKAMLRRSVNEEKDNTYIYRTGNLVLDIDCREVFCGEKKVKLTKGEFNLISVLVMNAGRVVDRNAMLEALGGDAFTPYEDNTLSVHLCRAREKLNKADGEKYFVTVRGIGYRWIKPIEKELKRC